MRLLVAIVFSLGRTSLAFGQIDETTLRRQYGSPLNRQTFKVRPNIEMILNYGPTQQARRIELPPGLNR